MKKLLLASLFLVLQVVPAVTTAADIAVGKAKSAICATCHGVDGVSAVPVYPNLKGQKEAYLLSSMKAYKSGDRKGGMAAIMKPQATLLSETDMANLAAYYSSLK